MPFAAAARHCASFSVLCLGTAALPGKLLLQEPVLLALSSI
jgi:hypothetical protein